MTESTLLAGYYCSAVVGEVFEDEGVLGMGGYYFFVVVDC